MSDPQTKTAAEQLGWSRDAYSKSNREVYAWLGNPARRIACIDDCPRGWAVRFYAIPWNQPSATEIFPTHAEAMAAVAAYVAGLDIDPAEPTSDTQSR